MPYRTQFILIVGAFVAGCGDNRQPQETSPSGTLSPRALVLATTTSTQDSGLLHALLPRFREATGIEVKVVAVGSGEAIELGRRGDADVLLAHSPEAEEQFVQQGHAVRRPLMYNDFVLVGPPADPANIKGESSAAAALRKIAHSSTPFASRGDNSGTHTKERSLWQAAQLQPMGDWYLKAGSGMAETLRVANEKSAYTLTDRATFLAQRAKLDLIVLVEEDEQLLNHYSVLQLNADKHPDLNHEGAQKLISFLFGQTGREIISDFGREKYGEPLFRLLPKKL